MQRLTITLNLLIRNSLFSSLLVPLLLLLFMFAPFPQLDGHKLAVSVAHICLSFFLCLD